MTETPAAPGTIAELLLARAEDDRPGMWFEGRTWTWREVVADSGARARLALDLQVPDRPFHIGVLLENVPEYVLWMGGAALTGATVVGININWGDQATLTHVTLINGKSTHVCAEYQGAPKGSEPTYLQDGWGDAYCHVSKSDVTYQ